MATINVTVGMDLHNCSTCGCIWGMTTGLKNWWCPSCASREVNRLRGVLDEALLREAKALRSVRGLRGASKRRKKL